MRATWIKLLPRLDRQTGLYTKYRSAVPLRNPFRPTLPVAMGGNTPHAGAKGRDPSVNELRERAELWWVGPAPVGRWLRKGNVRDRDRLVLTAGALEREGAC